MFTPKQIWPDKKSFPDWLPKRFTARERNLVAAFTPHRDGWVRWYKGETAFVCGKKTPIEELDARWSEKKVELDARVVDAVEDAKRSTSLTFEQFASLFYEFNDARVTTGKPKRISAVTAWDYQRVINAFGAFIGPDTLLDDLGPGLFSEYAKTIHDRAASSWNRVVAYLSALVTWGLARGLFANNASLKGIVVGQDPARQIMGPDFVKVPAGDLRDSRIAREKCYSPDELRALWSAANDVEKLWIGLGVNGAFDNADLANLPRSVVDLGNGIIDFSRRKVGRVRRLIPLVPELVELLRAYERPSPADPFLAELFFLTPTGLKLQRIEPTAVDYVSMEWTRLMQRAGLRPAPKWVTDPNTKKSRKAMPEGYEADGRGYRSLRTTFANLAPAGFREEVEIVMGHAQGEVLLDNYLERHSLGRLAQLTQHVWHRAFSCPNKLGEDCQCAAKGKRRTRQKQGTSR